METVKVPSFDDVVGSDYWKDLSPQGRKTYLPEIRKLMLDRAGQPGAVFEVDGNVVKAQPDDGNPGRPRQSFVEDIDETVDKLGLVADIPIQKQDGQLTPPTRAAIDERVSTADLEADNHEAAMAAFTGGFMNLYNQYRSEVKNGEWGREWKSVELGGTKFNQRDEDPDNIRHYLRWLDMKGRMSQLKETTGGAWDGAEAYKSGSDFVVDPKLTEKFEFFRKQAYPTEEEAEARRTAPPVEVNNGKIHFNAMSIEMADPETVKRQIEMAETSRLEKDRAKERFDRFSGRYYESLLEVGIRSKQGLLQKPANLLGREFNPETGKTEFSWSNLGRGVANLNPLVGGWLTQNKSDDNWWQLGTDPAEQARLFVDHRKKQGKEPGEIWTEFRDAFGVDERGVLTDWSESAQAAIGKNAMNATSSMLNLMAYPEAMVRQLFSEDTLKPLNVSKYSSFADSALDFAQISGDIQESIDIDRDKRLSAILNRSNPTLMTIPVGENEVDVSMHDITDVGAQVGMALAVGKIFGAPSASSRATISGRMTAGQRVEAGLQAMTAGPVASAGFGAMTAGGSAYGQTYNQVRNAGADHETAHNAASVNSVIHAAITGGTIFGMGYGIGALSSPKAFIQGYRSAKGGLVDRLRSGFSKSGYIGGAETGTKDFATGIAAAARRLDVAKATAKVGKEAAAKVGKGNLAQSLTDDVMDGLKEWFGKHRSVAMGRLGYYGAKANALTWNMIEEGAEEVVEQIGQNAATSLAIVGKMLPDEATPVEGWFPSALTIVKSAVLGAIGGFGGGGINTIADVVTRVKDPEFKKLVEENTKRGVEIFQRLDANQVRTHTLSDVADANLEGGSNALEQLTEAQLEAFEAENAPEIESTGRRQFAQQVSELSKQYDTGGMLTGMMEVAPRVRPNTRTDETVEQAQQARGTAQPGATVSQGVRTARTDPEATARNTRPPSTGKMSERSKVFIMPVVGRKSSKGAKPGEGKPVTLFGAGTTTISDVATRVFGRPAPGKKWRAVEKHAGLKPESFNLRQLKDGAYQVFVNDQATSRGYDPDTDVFYDLDLETGKKNGVRVPGTGVSIGRFFNEQQLQEGLSEAERAVEFQNGAELHRVDDTGKAGVVTEQKDNGWNIVRKKADGTVAEVVSFPAEHDVRAWLSENGYTQRTPAAQVDESSSTETEKPGAEAAQKGVRGTSTEGGPDAGGVEQTGPGRTGEGDGGVQQEGEAPATGSEGRADANQVGPTSPALSRTGQRGKLLKEARDLERAAERLEADIKAEEDSDIKNQLIPAHRALRDKARIAQKRVADFDKEAKRGLGADTVAEEEPTPIVPDGTDIAQISQQDFKQLTEGQDAKSLNLTWDPNESPNAVNRRLSMSSIIAVRNADGSLNYYEVADVVHNVDGSETYMLSGFESDAKVKARLGRNLFQNKKAREMIAGAIQGQAMEEDQVGPLVVSLLGAINQMPAAHNRSLLVEDSTIDTAFETKPTEDGLGSRFHYNPVKVLEQMELPASRIRAGSLVLGEQAEEFDWLVDDITGALAFQMFEEVAHRVALEEFNKPEEVIAMIGDVAAVAFAKNEKGEFSGPQGMINLLQGYINQEARRAGLGTVAETVTEMERLWDEDFDEDARWHVGHEFLAGMAQLLTTGNRTADINYAAMRWLGLAPAVTPAGAPVFTEGVAEGQGPKGTVRRAIERLVEVIRRMTGAMYRFVGAKSMLMDLPQSARNMVVRMESVLRQNGVAQMMDVYNVTGRATEHLTSGRFDRTKIEGDKGLVSAQESLRNTLSDVARFMKVPISGIIEVAEEEGTLRLKLTPEMEAMKDGSPQLQQIEADLARVEKNTTMMATIGHMVGRYNAARAFAEQTAQAAGVADAEAALGTLFQTSDPSNLLAWMGRESSKRHTRFTRADDLAQSPGSPGHEGYWGEISDPRHNFLQMVQQGLVTATDFKELLQRAQKSQKPVFNREWQPGFIPGGKQPKGFVEGESGNRAVVGFSSTGEEIEVFSGVDNQTLLDRAELLENLLYEGNSNEAAYQSEQGDLLRAEYTAIQTELQYRQAEITRPNTRNLSPRFRQDVLLALLGDVELEGEQAPYQSAFERLKAAAVLEHANRQGRVVGQAVENLILGRMPRDPEKTTRAWNEFIPIEPIGDPTIDHYRADGEWQTDDEGRLVWRDGGRAPESNPMTMTTPGIVLASMVEGKENPVAMDINSQGLHEAEQLGAMDARGASPQMQNARLLQPSDGFRFRVNQYDPSNSNESLATFNVRAVAETERAVEFSYQMFGHLGPVKRDRRAASNNLAPAGQRHYLEMGDNIPHLTWEARSNVNRSFAQADPGLVDLDLQSMGFPMQTAFIDVKLENDETRRMWTMVRPTTIFETPQLYDPKGDLKPSQAQSLDGQKTAATIAMLKSAVAVTKALADGANPWSEGGATLTGTMPEGYSEGGHTRAKLMTEQGATPAGLVYFSTAPHVLQTLGFLKSKWVREAALEATTDETRDGVKAFFKAIDKSGVLDGIHEDFANQFEIDKTGTDGETTTKSYDWMRGDTFTQINDVLNETRRMLKLGQRIYNQSGHNQTRRIREILNRQVMNGGTKEQSFMIPIDLKLADKLDFGIDHHRERIEKFVQEGKLPVTWDAVTATELLWLIRSARFEINTEFGETSDEIGRKPRPFPDDEQEAALYEQQQQWEQGKKWRMMHQSLRKRMTLALYIINKYDGVRVRQFLAQSDYRGLALDANGNVTVEFNTEALADYIENQLEKVAADEQARYPRGIDGHSTKTGDPKAFVGEDAIDALLEFVTNDESAAMIRIEPTQEAPVGPEVPVSPTMERAQQATEAEIGRLKDDAGLVESIGRNMGLLSDAGVGPITGDAGPTVMKGLDSLKLEVGKIGDAKWDPAMQVMSFDEFLDLMPNLTANARMLMTQAVNEMSKEVAEPGTFDWLNAVVKKADSIFSYDVTELARMEEPLTHLANRMRTAAEAKRPEIVERTGPTPIEEASYNPLTDLLNNPGKHGVVVALSTGAASSTRVPGTPIEQFIEGRKEPHQLAFDLANLVPGLTLVTATKFPRDGVQFPTHLAMKGQQAVAFIPSTGMSVAEGGTFVRQLLDWSTRSRENWGKRQKDIGRAVKNAFAPLDNLTRLSDAYEQQLFEDYRTRYAAWKAENAESQRVLTEAEAKRKNPPQGITKGEENARLRRLKELAQLVAARKRRRVAELLEDVQGIELDPEKGVVLASQIEGLSRLLMDPRVAMAIRTAALTDSASPAIPATIHPMAVNLADSVVDATNQQGMAETTDNWGDRAQAFEAEGMNIFRKDFEESEREKGFQWADDAAQAPAGSFGSFTEMFEAIYAEQNPLQDVDQVRWIDNTEPFVRATLARSFDSVVKTLLGVESDPVVTPAVEAVPEGVGELAEEFRMGQITALIAPKTSDQIFRNSKGEFPMSTEHLMAEARHFADNRLRGLHGPDGEVDGDGVDLKLSLVTPFEDAFGPLPSINPLDYLEGGVDPNDEYYKENRLRRGVFEFAHALAMTGIPGVVQTNEDGSFSIDVRGDNLRKLLDAAKLNDQKTRMKVHPETGEVTREGLVDKDGHPVRLAEGVRADVNQELEAERRNMKDLGKKAQELEDEAAELEQLKDVLEDGAKVTTLAELAEVRRKIAENGGRYVLGLTELAAFVGATGGDVDAFTARIATHLIGTLNAEAGHGAYVHPGVAMQDLARGIASEVGQAMSEGLGGLTTLFLNLADQLDFYRAETSRAGHGSQQVSATMQGKFSVGAPTAAEMDLGTTMFERDTENPWQTNKVTTGRRGRLTEAADQINQTVDHLESVVRRIPGFKHIDMRALRVPRDAGALARQFRSRQELLDHIEKEGDRIAGATDSQISDKGQIIGNLLPRTVQEAIVGREAEFERGRMVRPARSPMSEFTPLDISLQLDPEAVAEIQKILQAEAAVIKTRRGKLPPYLKLLEVTGIKAAKMEQAGKIRHVREYRQRLVDRISDVLKSRMKFDPEQLQGKFDGMRAHLAQRIGRLGLSAFSVERAAEIEAELREAVQVRGGFTENTDLKLAHEIAIKRHINEVLSNIRNGNEFISDKTYVKLMADVVLSTASHGVHDQRFINGFKNDKAVKIILRGDMNDVMVAQRAFRELYDTRYDAAYRRLKMRGRLNQGFQAANEMFEQVGNAAVTLDLSNLMKEGTPGTIVDGMFVPTDAHQSLTDLYERMGKGPVPTGRVEQLANWLNSDPDLRGLGASTIYDPTNVDAQGFIADPWVIPGLKPEGMKKSLKKAQLLMRQRMSEIESAPWFSHDFSKTPLLQDLQERTKGPFRTMVKFLFETKAMADDSALVLSDATKTMLDDYLENGFDVAQLADMYGQVRSEIIGRDMLDVLTAGYVPTKRYNLLRGLMEQNALTMRMFARSYAALRTARSMIAEIEYGIDSQTGRNGFRAMELELSRYMEQRASVVKVRPIRKGTMKKTLKELPSELSKKTTMNDTEARSLAYMVAVLRSSMGKYEIDANEGRFFNQDGTRNRVAIIEERSRRATRVMTQAEEGLAGLDEGAAMEKHEWDAADGVLKSIIPNLKGKTRAMFINFRKEWRTKGRNVVENAPGTGRNYRRIEPFLQAMADETNMQSNETINTAIMDMLRAETGDSKLAAKISTYANDIGHTLYGIRVLHGGVASMFGQDITAPPVPLVFKSVTRLGERVLNEDPEGELAKQESWDISGGRFNASSTPTLTHMKLWDADGISAPLAVIQDSLYRMMNAPSLTVFRKMFGSSEIVNGRIQLQRYVSDQDRETARHAYEHTSESDPEREQKLAEADRLLQPSYHSFLMNEAQAQFEADRDIRKFDGAQAVVATLSNMVDSQIDYDRAEKGEGTKAEQMLFGIGTVGMGQALTSMVQPIRQTVPAMMAYTTLSLGIGRGFVGGMSDGMSRGSTAMGLLMSQINPFASKTRENLSKFVQEHSPYVFVRGPNGVNMAYRTIERSRKMGARLDAQDSKLQKALLVASRTPAAIGRAGQMVVDGFTAQLDFTMAHPESFAVRAIYVTELFHAYNSKVDQTDQVKSIEDFIALPKSRLQNKLTTLDYENARIRSIEVMAQSDTSKKGVWTHRSGDIWGNMMKTALFTFSNHLLSTAAHSHAAWRMMLGGNVLDFLSGQQTDPEMRARGRRLFAANQIQNTFYAWCTHAMLGQLLGAMISGWKGEDEERKFQDFWHGHGWFGANSGSTQDIIQRAFVRALTGQRGEIGYNVRTDEFDQEYYDRYMAGLTGRTFREIATQMPYIGMFMAINPVQGMVENWIEKPIVSHMTGTKQRFQTAGVRWEGEEPTSFFGKTGEVMSGFAANNASAVGYYGIPVENLMNAVVLMTNARQPWDDQDAWPSIGMGLTQLGGGRDMRSFFEEQRRMKADVDYFKRPEYPKKESGGSGFSLGGGGRRGGGLF